MTFNPDADVSKNRARRGGRTAAIAGGGAIGLGAIAVLVINLLTGGDVDLSALLGGGTTDQGSSSSVDGALIEDCDTGADANENDDCRLAAATLAIDQYWEEHVDGYTPAGFIVVDGSTSSPCGTASNAVGPFYCPSDQTVYIDPSFFQILREQYGATAGALSQLYVLAHEYGHHVQNLVGTMAQYPDNGTGPASNGVRMELQADCYAGSWIGAMTEQTDDKGVPYLEAPTEEQLTDALGAAAAVGDDHIQEQSGGVSNPENWTHGSSAQRDYWFATGYKYGFDRCDTFAASEAELTA